MKRKTCFAAVIIWAVCITTPFSGWANTMPILAGHWQGAIDIPGTRLEIDLDFYLQPDGSWKGDISIPLQQATDLPLTGIVIQGTEVSFGISDVPGEPVFKGNLAEDGSSISGDFSQSGQTFPFSLRREADPVSKARQVMETFGDLVEEALRTFEVPGLAMAVVKNDEVVFSRGFGYRDLGNRLPMTSDTLLAIGSSSKAFTVFTLGTLADRGLLEWDRPVRHYISWFRLHDPFMGERLTPRDLVTHRSGLPRHDLVWYNNHTASREEFVRRLAYLEPTADLREKFQYNNLMFLTAGYLIEVLAGETWEDAVRNLVLNPLGMNRTNFSVQDSQKDRDFALPYDQRDETIKRIPFRDISNIGPAGSINSSVNEMANWVMVHLNAGKFKGKRIINAAILQDMHLSRMPLGETPERPDISPAEYGMGWFTDNYRGHPRVYHGGNIDGFSALVSLLPRDRLGFVVLTNRNGTGLPELLVRTACDRLLELEKVGWLEEAAKRQDAARDAGREAEKKKSMKRVPKTRPAHPLEAYSGDFRHPGYGDLKVYVKDKKLYFTYNGIVTPLNHWHFETFNGGKASDPTFQDMKLTFRTDVNGRVSEVMAPFEATLDDIRFEKQPDACYFDAGYLKRFEGKYNLLDQTFTVSLKGNSLSILFPGSPVMDLMPELGGEFTLKQVKIVSLKFVQDKAGRVTGFQLFQPNGVFEARRLPEN